MKILFVCQYYYPEQFKINDICSELAKGGHEITVLTGLPNYTSGIVKNEYRGYNNRVEIIDGVKVVRSWLRGRGKGNINLGLNYLSFAISATFKALFLKKDFELILVYQLSPVTMALPAILLKWLTKVPMALYCFDLWPESVISGGISTDSRVYKVLYKMSRWIYSKADLILTSSKQFAEYFSDTLKLNKKIVNLPIYAEDIFDDISKNTDGKTNLVFAGNIGEMQSVETIIKAANELKANKDILFHIVGDGSARLTCFELTESLGLKNIIFHGSFPLSEMPKFYSLADAFLVTLKANKAISYTLPGKVQTYLAAGKPIIGAIDGETSLVIKEAKCGLCSEAEDYLALAENIRKFYSEDEMKSIYSANSKKYYDNNFSKQIYFEKLNDIFNEITK